MPPAGYSTWEEFYRERAANPQMFGDGTSIGPSYPDRFTGEFANSPFIRLLAPWAKTSLMKTDAPLHEISPGGMFLSVLDAATGPLPLGLIAGRVKDIAKEPITNIGQWLIKVRTKGPDWLNHKQVKEESKKLDLPDHPIGRGVHYDTIKKADDAIKSGNSDEFMVLPRGNQGREHLKISESHFTQRGQRRNIPKQRDFLSTYKTRTHPEGFDVDNMSDDEVGYIMRKIHWWKTNPGSRNKAYAHIDEDIPGLSSGNRAVSVSSNPEIQKKIVGLDDAYLDNLALQQVYSYLNRAGLGIRDIPRSEYEKLFYVVRQNLKLRGERFKAAKPLWELNQPQLTVETHHGRPTGLGGSPRDIRNIWAVSGAAGQEGTHGLAHRWKEKLDPFYNKLRAKYYNPFYEEAIKSSKRKLEPYPGWLDEMQELDTSMWDYNMRRAFEMFRD